MGYYTRFSLGVNADNEDQIIAEFRGECDYAEHCLTETGSTNEPGKWYNHDEDIRKFSKKYPDVLFEMRGEGEEAGDLWVLYAQNGKVHKSRAKVIYEEFDPEKLI